MIWNTDVEDAREEWMFLGQLEEDLGPEAPLSQEELEAMMLFHFGHLEENELA
jgi:hypothetical protein